MVTVSMIKKAISQISFPRDIELWRVLNLAHEAGFEGVELKLNERGEFSILSSKSEISDIRKKATSLGIDICSVAGGLQWKYPLSSPITSIREAGIKAAKKAVEFASILGAKVVLIVPAVITKDLLYDKAWKIALNSIVEIGKLAERLGVFVGVENVWNNFIFTPTEMLRFIKEANSMLRNEPISAYLDIGNIIPFGYPEHWITYLGNNIKAIHIKDMKLLGKTPVAVMPPHGDVDWLSVMKALRAVGYKGYLTIEVRLPKLGLKLSLIHI